MALSSSGDLWAWGVNKRNELGINSLSGSFQPTPARVEMDINGTRYKVRQVACGAAHTAVVLQEENTEPLRLLYSPNFDLSLVMNQVRENLAQDMEVESLENYRVNILKGDSSLDQLQIRKFFKRFLGTEQKKEDLDEITRLFMTKAKGGRLQYKEFRDQVHGMRVGEGKVATWGVETNGRLGREPKSSQSLNILVQIEESNIIRKVSCGDSHTLALGQGKLLYAWGGNQYGQLGTGNTHESWRPIQIRLPDNVDIIDIAAGGMHSLCATAGDNQAYSWGYGEGGRLGHGESQLELSPKRIANLVDVIAVAAGHSHSGFICTDKVYTCGKGLFARLGHGTLNDEYVPRSLEFFQGKSLVKMSLSFFHSAGLTLNGEAYTWGDSKYGRCGTGSSDGENILLPRRVGTGSLLAAMKITDIALGLNHGLAVTADGSVYVWGDGSDGKLGLLDHKEVEILPKKIPDLDIRKDLDINLDKEKRPVNSTRVVQLAANDFCTAIVTDAGEIKIWGNNSEGQLGIKDDGEESDRESGSEADILVDNPADEEHKFAALMKKKMAKDCYEPIYIPFFHHSKTMKVGRVYGAANHFFAITMEGLVYGWGSNQFGQLGLDGDDKVIARPRLLKSFRMMKVRRIATSPKHTAFVMDSGETFMCGNVNNGKLGLGLSILEGETKDIFIPRQLRSIVNVDRVACGSNHTLVYSMAGKLYSWGSGFLGVLGSGNSRDIFEPQVVNFNSFQPPLLLHEIKDIACGDFHSLIVTTTGVVYGCGLAQYAGLSSQRGSVFYFTIVLGFRQKIEKIFSGREHSIAITVTGQLYTWGKDLLKEMEKPTLGTKVEESSHVTVGKFSNPHPDDDSCILPSMIFVDMVASKAACGARHLVALSKTGSVYLWGQSANGRLGLGYESEKERSEEVILLPELNAKVQRWLDSSKEKEEKVEGEKGTSENSLQKLIKNEPNNCNEDELISDGANYLSQLTRILEKFAAFRVLEQERIRELNSIETLLVSGLPLVPSRIRPAVFHISMPVVISRNIQLFELMIALLQQHPCYIVTILRDNPQLSPIEAAAHIQHYFGDITDNSRLMKSLMALIFTLSAEIVQNLTEEAIMSQRNGILLETLNTTVLSSQNMNTKFFHLLTSAIIRLIITNVLSVSENKELPENILSLYDIEELRNFDMNQPKVKSVFDQRQGKLQTLMKPIKEYILSVLLFVPAVRNVFKGVRLTQELKFIYKEISRIVWERFSYLGHEKLNYLNRVKIYLMFISQVVAYLKDTNELPVNIDEEIKKALANRDQEGLYDSSYGSIENRNRQMRGIFSLVSKALDDLPEMYEENVAFFTQTYEELTNVPDSRLAELLLKDFILHSAETHDPILCIGVGDLLQLYQLVYVNIWRIKDSFGVEDPLVQVTESLGDIESMTEALYKTDIFKQQVNLHIPSRWLLREQAIQACPRCSMPLTYSFLQKKDMQENITPDTPISVPNKWRCMVCGTGQEGWSGTCSICKEPRDEYPKSALFQTYVSIGRNPIIVAFTEMLRIMPDIPDHIPVVAYIDKMESEGKSQIAMKIREVEELARKGTDISGPGVRALKRSLEMLSKETRAAYDHRARYRVYLDSIQGLLNAIDSSIKQITVQMRIIVQTDFRKVTDCIEHGNSMKILKPAFTLAPRSMAFGEFSLYRMIQDGTLRNQDVPMQQRKKTTVSISEMEDGSFEVKFLFLEGNSALKFRADALVVQTYNFKISPERQHLMRRTMHYQALTTFEDGLLMFDVKKLIHLLNKLV